MIKGEVMGPLKKIILIILPVVALLGEDIQNRIYTIIKIDTPPVIDGVPDDPVWESAVVADKFTQYMPESGAPGIQPTEARVLYDDDYIYIAARMYDDPKLISAQLLRRDTRGVSDQFGVGIDSYNDKRTGFSFYLTPLGTKQDMLWYNDEFSDASWDAVWDGVAVIDGEGWTVEMRIPFSQLRYDQTIAQPEWGIQFYRYISRNDEHDYWNHLPVESNSEVAAYGTLRGLVHPPPVKRIEVLPYASGGAINVPEDNDNPFYSEYDLTGGIGADLKIGLGSNFTLTSAINPDFGQVEADPAQVNLTANETFYVEKRPFFVEGVDIIDFGSTRSFYSNLPIMFYSRRVGRTPQGSISDGAEDYSDYPDKTRIAAASKISGKTNRGLSLSFFDAVTMNESAVYTDTLGVEKEEIVEPLANSLVGRVKQDFNAGNSYLGAYGAMVNRNLSTPALEDQFRENAVLAGIDFEHRINKFPNWVASGVYVQSYLNGSAAVITEAQEASPRYFQRPDADYMELDETATALSGHSFEMTLMKNKGRHQGSFTYAEVSPGFEPNDIGFEVRADYRSWGILYKYRQTDPGEKIRYWQLLAGWFPAWNFGGDLVWAYGLLSYYANFTNLWNMNLRFEQSVPHYDDHLTRGGPLVRGLADTELSFSLNSNSRKKLSFGSYIRKTRDNSGAGDLNTEISMAYKPQSNINIELSTGLDFSNRTNQYVDAIEDDLAAETFGTRYIFSDLSGKTHWATGRLEWTFSPELTLQLVVCPYVSDYDYSQFKQLARPASYEFDTYGTDAGTIEQDETGDYIIDPDGDSAADEFSITNPDFYYNSMQLNTVLRWEFRPGSALYLVWQFDQNDFNYVINHSRGPVFDNYGDLIRVEPTNILLVKFVYWFGN